MVPDNLWGKRVFHMKSSTETVDVKYIREQNKNIPKKSRNEFSKHADIDI